MAGLPSTVVSYCKYAPEWGYRKNTRIFSNALHLWQGQRCRNDCLAMVCSACGWRHKHTAQRGGSKGWPMDRCFSQAELYRIPPLLVQELLNAISPSLQGDPAS